MDVGDAHTWGRVLRRLGASVSFTVAVSTPQNNERPESGSEGRGEGGTGASSSFRFLHFMAQVSEMCWSSDEEEMLVDGALGNKRRPSTLMPHPLPVFSAGLGLSPPPLFRSSMAIGEPLKI